MNLYQYVGNHPAVAVDAYGTVQTLTITEVQPFDPGFCGAHTWVIQWKITEDAPKGGGHVVQKVSRNYNITDCDGKDITLDQMKKKVKKKGNKDGGTTIEFREAWPINEGQKVTKWAEKGDNKDDLYSSVEFDICTIGTITTTGRAKFHNGALPAGWVSFNKDTLAGILQSTTDDPSTDKPPLDAGTPAVNHDLTVKWDCCGPDKKGVRARTEKVYQDPK
jgi:hypothetical protein